MSKKTRDERIKDAILWKLGQRFPPAEEKQIRTDWIHIWNRVNGAPDGKRRFIELLVNPLIEIIERGLTCPSPSQEKRWLDLQKYLCTQGELPRMMAHKAAPLYDDITKPLSPTPAPIPTSNRGGEMNAPEAPTQSNPTLQESSTALPATNDDSNPPNSETMDETPPSIVPQWKYLGVSDELDSHTEHASKPGASPEGLKIIGARARGKKHKHEGTHCDDWFEFGFSGPWTIIAVSDGAGSKKFSRVGAKVACQQAVKQLTEDLKDHHLGPREAWTDEILRREESTGAFAEEDLETVQRALHRAMEAAYNAIVTAVEERTNNIEHEKVLGRKLEVDDLAATLLLAVHTTIQKNNEDYSFVLTCQVGDGMMGAIDRKGRLQLLGEPDTGEFAGQTDFLTNPKKRERDNLWRKTFGFFRPLQVLMAMTDGVADDYYPNDPGLLRLYADLVLNQVIEIHGPTDDEIATALQQTQLPTLDEVLHADFHSSVQTLAEEPKTVRLRSALTYAEKLNVPLTELAASPMLLLAGARGEPMCDESRVEDRLHIWLDSYQVRGSFDDRTLVILYRENVSL